MFLKPILLESAQLTVRVEKKSTVVNICVCWLIFNKYYRHRWFAHIAYLSYFLTGAAFFSIVYCLGNIHRRAAELVKMLAKS